MCEGASYSTGVGNTQIPAEMSRCPCVSDRGVEHKLTPIFAGEYISRPLAQVNIWSLNFQEAEHNWICVCEVNSSTVTHCHQTHKKKQADFRHHHHHHHHLPVAQADNSCLFLPAKSVICECNLKLSSCHLSTTFLPAVSAVASFTK